MLEFLPSYETLVSAGLFLAALLTMVSIHEWGHCMVAKLCGVRVDIFSIGIGPRLFGIKIGGTDYRIAPIPLGGFVKIYGQDPHEEAEGDSVLAEKISRDPEAFYSKSYWQKIAIVFAGPLMNFVLCLLVMPLVFMLGREQYKVFDEPPVVVDVRENSPAHAAGFQKGDLVLSFGGRSVSNWKELMAEIALSPDEVQVPVLVKRDQKEVVLEPTILELSKVKKNASGMAKNAGYLGIEIIEFIDNVPVIGTVSPGLPAAKAGIEAGDKIISIDGKPIQYWSEILENLSALLPQDRSQLQDGSSVSQPVQIVLERGGQMHTINVLPTYSAEDEKYLIGIMRKQDESLLVLKKYSLGESLVLGWQENMRLMSMTFDILGRIVTGNFALKNLNGPLQIAKVSTDTARDGLKNGLGGFFFLMSFLSLQLGIMNLLPIPVLDGGHIVFITAEAILRKPLSVKFRQVSMQLGLIMLLLLMMRATFNDINSLWGFSNIFESIKNLF